MWPRKQPWMPRTSPLTGLRPGSRGSRTVAMTRCPSSSVSSAAEYRSGQTTRRPPPGRHDLVQEVPHEGGLAVPGQHRQREPGDPQILVVDRLGERDDVRRLVPDERGGRRAGGSQPAQRRDAGGGRLDGRVNGGPRGSPWSRTPDHPGVPAQRVEVVVLRVLLVRAEREDRRRRGTRPPRRSSPRLRTGPGRTPLPDLPAARSAGAHRTDTRAGTPLRATTRPGRLRRPSRRSPRSRRPVARARPPT